MRNRLFKCTTFLLLAVLLVAPVIQTNGLAAAPPFGSAMLLRAGERDGDRVSAEPVIPAGFDFKPSKKYLFSDVKKAIAERQKKNVDVKGWLIVPGTNISEPVLADQRETAIDNSYYSHRTWEGVDYPNLNYLNYVYTAANVDFRTIFGENWSKTSRNTTIFGHNWTNLRNPLDIGNNPKHIMFGQLPSYTDINFAKENPYIYYSTGELEGIWKVFTVAYCEDDSSRFFYTNPNPHKETYQKLLDEWKLRTMYNFNVDVQTTDRILTLSTCTRWYSGVSDLQRFVVVARLLRDGESENDPVKVTVNPKPKQPVFKLPEASSSTASSSSTDASSTASSSSAASSSSTASSSTASSSSAQQ